MLNIVIKPQHNFKSIIIPQASSQLCPWLYIDGYKRKVKLFAIDNIWNGNDMPKRNFVFFPFVLCAEIPFECNWNINPGHLLKKLELNWPTKSNESLEMTQPNYIIVIYCHNFFPFVPYFLLVNECYLMSSEISM